MLGLWAALCFGGALYASWLGYGGREFAATLTAFAYFLGVMLLLAARGVADSLSSRWGAGGGGYLLGAAVFLGYLIYALGTNTFAIARVGAVAGLVFVPLALATSARQRSIGAWQDYATLVGVWVVVKPLPNPWGISLSHWLWPYPGGKLAYVLTVLLSLNVALAAYVLVRRFNTPGPSLCSGPPLGSSFLALLPTLPGT